MTPKNANEIVTVFRAWLDDGRLAATLSDLTVSDAYKTSKRVRDFVDALIVARVESNKSAKHIEAADAHVVAADAHVRPGTGGRMVDATPNSAHALSLRALAATVVLDDAKCNALAKYASGSSALFCHYNAAAYHRAAADLHRARAIGR